LDKEISLLTGETILDNNNRQARWAEALEYRQAFMQHGDWTVSLLNEDDPRVDRRYGLAAEGWAVFPFSGNQWTVGLGAGPYVPVGQEHALSATVSSAPTVSGIISATASRKISDRWLARLSLNRIATRNNNDTDMVLLGLGYRL
jgi:hypothetical protein